jgi:hypothetical protein
MYLLIIEVVISLKTTKYFEHFLRHAKQFIQI